MYVAFTPDRIQGERKYRTPGFHSERRVLDPQGNPRHNSHRSRGWIYKRRQINAAANKTSNRQSIIIRLAWTTDVVVQHVSKD